MLELTEVNSFCGNSHILHNVSLAVEAGGFTAIVGRNGMGKTMLLKTIMGLTDRVRGSIALGTHSLTSLPTHLRAKAGIGYVPQGRDIIHQFTVKENILMGCYARSDGKKRLPELVLDLFPYLRENLNRRAGLLSGGQQQQLAIARALAANPNVLLLDEPTEGIQPNLVEQIEQTIIRLNREFGLTIVLVEQNIAFARRASRQFVMMNNGAVAACGAVSDLSDELVHEYMAV
ncbi:urea ABC transporter ATP-binding subunit UrtE [Leptolyngbya sp. FACHB-36]|uniref:urea ABC transporter ATP-binding subunit UrtE n=1 Tax=Leptolyngbya sp. FACHB-36 TaxID=2692808 RepID=UPI0016810176|nr:urea ABC transporter ATP-binding subunit UrtE [Leptolyngbya sp. FACHB-36]MBD2019879.1 urea ABC transporter ATP-binding subunit UrtE [Leptolyngbya sp. FACHB-36]